MCVQPLRSWRCVLCQHQPRVAVVKDEKFITPPATHTFGDACPIHTRSNTTRSFKCDVILPLTAPEENPSLKGHIHRDNETACYWSMSFSDLWPSEHPQKKRHSRLWFRDTGTVHRCDASVENPLATVACRRIHPSDVNNAVVYRCTHIVCRCSTSNSVCRQVMCGQRSTKKQSGSVKERKHRR